MVVLLLLLALLTGLDAGAQALYRCQDPQGNVTLMENQCAPGETLQKLPPPPAQLHPDLASLCSANARKDLRRGAACGMMLSCRDDDRSNCAIYCSDEFQSSFPGLPLGPASPTCLKLTGRKRGANWVQAGSRSRISGRYEFEGFDVYCVDSRNAVFPRHEGFYCKRGTSECARQIDALPRKAESPDEVATAMCREKYGTQLAPAPRR